MKIDFSNVKNSPFAEAGVKASTSENLSHAKKTDISESGYILDISSTVKDNAALGNYNDQGKNIEECMQEVIGSGISAQDVSLQRNYYAVMSNSLSAEDYAKMNKDGFDISDMTAEEIVTVVDEIKVKLAEAGVEISGYNDSLDSDTVESVTGSASRASMIVNSLRSNDLPVTNSNYNQFEEVLNISDELCSLTDNGNLTDASIRYILDNDINPTLSNVYLAQFKSQPFATRVLSDSDFMNIMGQVTKVISDAGYEVNDETIADARWLIENQLPLTKESFDSFEKLNEISFPLDNAELLDSAAFALSQGFSAKDASLIKNERILAEARLSMTTEANRHLLMSDFSIDTKEMELQLEKLKNLENALTSQTSDKMQEYRYSQRNTSVNKGATVSDFYNITLRSIDQIKSMPAAVIGEVSAFKDYSFTDIYEKGTAWQIRYEKAEATYEAVGTQVRTDLGDSIKKAFQNAEDILKEMNISPNESNKRAVRILGYNSMDINEENIVRVKEADAKINHCIDQLKPASVLRLIREGHNPLNMSVKELSDTLDSFQNEDTKNGKFSEFLWKLEKNNAISEEEKQSYIGIYRLFRQVEKTDGAVIGGLINQGADLSIKNLLSAVRSRKSKGMDYTVDDTFGGLSALENTETLTISDQIGQAFITREYISDRVKDTLERLDEAKLFTMDQNNELSMNTTIDQLFDGMNQDLSDENAAASQSIINQYNEEMAANVREAMDSEDQVISLLENYGFTPTFDNIVTARQMLMKRGDAFRQLSKLIDTVNTSDIIERFDSQENAAEAIDELVDKAYEDINLLMDQAVTSERFNLLSLLGKQFTMIKQMSKQENYEVPVEIDGETTSINLKVIHGTGKSSLEATLYTDDYGPLSIHLNPADNNIDGYMIGATYDGIEFLQTKKQELIDAFHNAGEELSPSFEIMRRPDLDISTIASSNPGSENSSSADSKRLYGLAKIFLATMNH